MENDLRHGMEDDLPRLVIIRRRALALAAGEGSSAAGRHSGGAPVLRHLGVLVAAPDAQCCMRFHDRSAAGEDSDDSDDEHQSDNVTAWKLGSAKKSLA